MTFETIESSIEALAVKAGERLLAAGMMLASAESCTGGMVAAAMTAVAGSSAWFERGFVTYSNQAKIDSIAVPSALIDAHGAVSEPVARAMAEGAARVSAAGLALAITGIAGPSGGTPEKPVGTVCFAWSNGTRTRAETHHFDGDRRAVRLQATELALRGVCEWLQR